MIQILFKFAYFSFFPYSFGIETINTFIHSVVSSKTIPDSRPEWAKCIPVFRPKRRKNPTRWGGTYLYGLYKGVPPPPRETSSSKLSHFLVNLTRDCGSHVCPLKSTCSVLSLIRIAFLSINAIIGFDVLESLNLKSSFTAMVAVTSGAVDKVLFAE